MADLPKYVTVTPAGTYRVRLPRGLAEQYNGGKRHVGTYPTLEEATAARFDVLGFDPDEPAQADTAPAPEPPRSGDIDGSDWLFEEKYVYNADNDRYITFLSSTPQPVVVSGDKHRAMKRAYSNWDGQPSTINEICRQFSFPRAWFTEYKQIHGWTHDAEPFTTEELLDRDEEELLDELVQLKRQSLYLKWEKRKWKDTKDAAEKWHKFEQTIFLPLLSAIEQYAPAYDVPTLELAAPDTAFAAVLGTADLHFGKYGWSVDGVEYDRQIARERLTQATGVLLSRIARYGVPEQIYLVIGGDDEHVDTYAGTTTRGTPQDTDGTPAQIAIEYSELIVTYIDMLRQLGAPIEIYTTPGNHNKHVAIYRAKYVEAWYRTCDDVTVHVSDAPRSYVSYGNALLGFTHGDDVKERELPAIMSNEVPQAWGESAYRFMFLQHLHKEDRPERGGVKFYRMPSLSGHDRWHARKGYTTAVPGAAAYLIERDGGVYGTVFAAVDAEARD